MRLLKTIGLCLLIGTVSILISAFIDWVLDSPPNPERPYHVLIFIMLSWHVEKWIDE